MATTQTAYSLRQIDGGINYFSQFSHSLPTDPSFFPVGAWLEGVQTQQDVNRDKAAGFNMYVGITANSNFSLIQQNGMYVIAQADELRTNNTVINNSTTAGWLLYDEIDMVLGPGGFSTQQNIIASLPDDDRLIYNNYGKGVLFWQSNADAARYVNSVDVVSLDAYWFTDPNIDGGSEGGDLLNNGNPLSLTQTRLAANYGYAIDRVRALDATDGEPHPVWGFVELGWPFTETAAQGGRAIAPAEVKAAVWHQIIAGARGIIYFNHSFGGSEQTQNALRDPAYADIAATVTQTDALIKQLAPVINSPFDDAFVTVNSSVRAMSKYYNGEHYVFAGATVNGAATATDTFTLAGIGNGTAEVIGENRTIQIVNGQFADRFADGNAIHIYHIIANAFSNASLLVDTPSYLARNPDVFHFGAGAVEHYNAFGWKEGRDPNPFFSTNGYLSANADVAAAGINPLQHYDSFGWREGRDPAANFDTSLYLLRNPDVAAAGIDPLAHFLQFGQAEGRAASPAIGATIAAGFDFEFYRLANPDVGRAGVNPMTHYNTFGWREGRNPDAYFDTAGYLAHNPDVAAAGVNPLQHYDQFGWKEGRDPSGAFDTAAYLAAYPDVAAAHVDPLQHFLMYGVYEGRSSFSDGLFG